MAAVIDASLHRQKSGALSERALNGPGHSKDEALSPNARHPLGK